MLSGVIEGTFLCCEEDNITRIQTLSSDHDGTASEDSVTLEWSVHRIIIPIILISGILGNVLILAVLSAQTFRGIAYMYFRAIALAHTGVLIFWIPVSLRLGYGMSNDYSSTFYHAHLEMVVLNGFSAASILIMACLTVDRYVFVFFPARIRTGNVRKNVSSCILISFIISFVISAPLGGMRMIHEHQEGSDVLFTLEENVLVTNTFMWRMYIWAMEVLICIGPSIIFILLNSLVVKRFVHLNAKKRQFNAVSDKFRSANIGETSLITRNRGYREEQNLIMLTTTMVVSFFVTMIPALTLTIIHPDRPRSSFDYQKFRIFSAIAELSNYATHVFVYLLCSAEFRMEMLRVIRGKCNEDGDRSSEQPVGEIEDFSRHGTTVRLTPEHTRLNSPGSPCKADTIEDEKESQLLYPKDVT